MQPRPQGPQPRPGQPGQGQGPQGPQPHDDILVAAAEAAAALAALAVALPVLVVGAVTWLATRRASARARAVVGAAAAAGGAGVALGVGWRAAVARYALPYRELWAQAVHHHGHVAVGAVLGVLWLAVPVGVLVGLVGPVVLRRGQQQAEGAPAASGGKGKQGQGQSGAPKAGWRQVRPLVVRRPAGDRVVLGRLDGRLVAARVESHVAVIAPTRSGKTRGLVLPALLEWSGPAVATSAKSDLLWDPTYKSGAYTYRRTLGEVWVFDPSGSSGWPCVHWSPLGRAETWQGALRAAHAMVAASEGDPDSSTAKFFSARAAQALAPCLHAVSLAGGGMRDVLDLVRSCGSLRDLADELEGGLEGAVPEAQSALRALRAGSDTSSGDTLATLQNVLAPFDDPKVAENTATCEFDVTELVLGGNATLFILAGPDSKRLAPLFACLIDELFDAVAQLALRDGPLSRRLLMALDEVANIAPVPQLPQRLATVSGQGITVVTAWQSVSQMKRWGQHAGSEILGNSAAQLWAGSDDPETSEHLSRLLGRQLVATTSVSTPAQRGLFSPAPKPTSISTSWAERSVLDPSQSRLMSGPLLVAQGLPPTELQWRFHDQDRQLRARSSLPPPAPTAEAESEDEEHKELEVAL